MKKLLFTSIVLLLVCSVGLRAQDNQSKLDQIELSKKLAGKWKIETDKDTVNWFEMTLYKNAIVETMYRAINGTKILTGTCHITYNSQADNFKGLVMWPYGKVGYSFYAKFTSDKEVVFEIVEDFQTNKVKAQNKFTFVDPDHLNGDHFNSDQVKTSSTKWVRTGSGH